MKILNVVMLGALFSTILVAQNSSNISTPPDTQILSKSWRREVINTKLDADPFAANNQYRDRVFAQKQATEYNAKKPDGQRAVQPKAPPSEKPSVEMPRGVSAMYTYQAKVKNRGDKTIKSIEWEYVFLDPETKEEISRFQCVSKVKIGAGKSGDLIMSASTPPSNLIDARKTDKGQQQFIEQILISRIEYNDGSVWQRLQK